MYACRLGAHCKLSRMRLFCVCSQVVADESHPGCFGWHCSCSLCRTSSVPGAQASEKAQENRHFLPSCAPWIELHHMPAVTTPRYRGQACFEGLCRGAIPWLTPRASGSESKLLKVFRKKKNQPPPLNNVAVGLGLLHRERWQGRSVQALNGSLGHSFDH